MGITVRQVLTLEPLTDAHVLAGYGGLEHIVESVSVMDAPDVKNWVKGGEFLMTTAYIFKDNPRALLTLVQELHAKGVAALGIKLKRFIEELPGEVIEAAEQLDFPLIYLPISCSFSEIINPILSSIFNEQSRLITQSEKIHQKLTQIVLKGGSIDDVITEIKELTHSYIVFIPEEDLPELPITTGDGTGFKVPVQAGSRSYGTLVLSGDLIHPISKVAVTHAATVIALLLQREDAKKEVERQFRNEFIKELIFGHYEDKYEVFQRGDFYGWDLRRGHVVCVFSSKINTNQYSFEETATRKARSLLDTLISRYLKTWSSAGISVALRDYVIVLSPVADDKKVSGHIAKLKLFAQTVVQTANKQMPRVSFAAGISSYVEGIMDIGTGYTQAQRALALSEQIRGDNIVAAYDDLGVFRLFLGREEDQTLSEFYGEKLLPLVKFDASNHGNLIPTAEAFFASNQSLSQTAQHLFIHHNTLYYRLKKIEQILNISLQNSEDCLNLQIALKLAKILHTL